MRSDPARCCFPRCWGFSSSATVVHSGIRGEATAEPRSSCGEAPRSGGSRPRVRGFGRGRADVRARVDALPRASGWSLGVRAGAGVGGVSRRHRGGLSPRGRAFALACPPTSGIRPGRARVGWLRAAVPPALPWRAALALCRARSSAGRGLQRRAGHLGRSGDAHPSPGGPPRGDVSLDGCRLGA